MVATLELMKCWAQLVGQASRGEVSAIWLFGSRARGDNVPESDADVMIGIGNCGFLSFDDSDHARYLGYQSILDFVGSHQLTYGFGPGQINVGMEYVEQIEDISQAPWW